MASPPPPSRTAPVPSPSERKSGLLWGFVGVASFSLTLPATRVAVVPAAHGAVVATAIAGAWIAHERPAPVFWAWVLTIFASAWLLDEHIDAATYIAAARVIASIAVGRRAR